MSVLKKLAALEHRNPGKKVAMLATTWLFIFSATTSLAQSPPANPPAEWGPVSINLEEIPYPYPVQFLHRTLHGQDVRIAYMDAAPTGPANGRTVVLLHGSSYYSWYWGNTMKALTAAGFRVVAVDRLGWGRSSKPVMPYDVNLHGSNVMAILDHLGIEQVAIAGHSLGGLFWSNNSGHIFKHQFMINWRPSAVG